LSSLENKVGKIKISTLQYVIIHKTFLKERTNSELQKQENIEELLIFQLKPTISTTYQFVEKQRYPVEIERKQALNKLLIYPLFRVFLTPP
jgi:hypothetical protein